MPCSKPFSAGDGGWRERQPSEVGRVTKAYPRLVVGWPEAGSTSPLKEVPETIATLHQALLAFSDGCNECLSSSREILHPPECLFSGNPSSLRSFSLRIVILLGHDFFPPE